MIILGIESSCDETAVALVKNGKKVLAHQISSQIKDHAPFFGVVPEIASRKHLEWIFPLIEACCREAKMSLSNIDAIAVTREPGLMGSLLVGFTVAKTLAFALDKPFIPVNHLWAHFYAPFLNQEPLPFPYAGLLVSGGHTLLALIRNYHNIEILGSTIDDAVGECYDKVAKLLKLTYPGGPEIDRLAQQGNPDTYSLPFIQLNYEKDRYNFSYSGLKTAARRLIEKEANLNIKDFAASFQKKAIDILIKKSQLLCQDFHLKSLVVSGGVACNSYLRSQLTLLKKIQTAIPRHELCTDNAAMVAGLAYYLPQLSKKDFILLDVKDKVISALEKQKLRL